MVSAADMAFQLTSGSITISPATRRNPWSAVINSKPCSSAVAATIASGVFRRNCWRISTARSSTASDTDSCGSSKNRATKATASAAVSRVNPSTSTRLIAETAPPGCFTQGRKGAYSASGRAALIRVLLSNKYFMASTVPTVRPSWPARQVARPVGQGSFCRLLPGQK